MFGMSLLSTINTRGDVEFTFVKLTATTRGMELDYGWVLKVSSLLELMNYHMCQSHAAEAFLDYSAVVSKKQKHFANDRAQTAQIFAELKGTAVIKELCNMGAKSFEAQCKGLEAKGVIYIQHTGGWMTWDEENVWEEEEWSRDHLIFPDSDEIRVLQWPGGEHWYAKIGAVDVVIDGEQKWNTFNEADTAAKRFVDERITS